MWNRIKNLFKGFLSLFISGIEKANPKALIEAEKEKEAQIQQELNKGDEEKVRDLINDLRDLRMKYMFTSKKNQRMYDAVRNMLGKIIEYTE